jgi:hypothetical protein
MLPDKASVPSSRELSSDICTSSDSSWLQSQSSRWMRTWNQLQLLCLLPDGWRSDKHAIVAVAQPVGNKPVRIFSLEATSTHKGNVVTDLEVEGPSKIWGRQCNRDRTTTESWAISRISLRTFCHCNPIWMLQDLNRDLKSCLTRRNSFELFWFHIMVVVS